MVASTFRWYTRRGVTCGVTLPKTRRRRLPQAAGISVGVCTKPSPYPNYGGVCSKCSRYFRAAQRYNNYVHTVFLSLILIMKKLISLLLTIGAAAHSWSSGLPTAPSPTTLLPADQDSHGTPAIISRDDPVQWQSPTATLEGPVVHGSDFVLDYVLVVTYENTSIACQSRMSTLINGSTPGPTLRLQPGKTSWIRVYNNMADYNLTMVSDTHFGLYITNDSHPALARFKPAYCRLLGRYTKR
jgi:hypothetical protein